jgi:hypothetical protein
VTNINREMKKEGGKFPRINEERRKIKGPIKVIRENKRKRRKTKGKWVHGG